MKQASPINHEYSPPKAWLIVNIFLTVCCALALAYGVYSVSFHSDIFGFTGFIKSAVLGTGFALIAAPAILLSLIGLGSLAIAVIPSIALAFYFNAGYAIYFYIINRQSHPGYATKNLIFAVIPPVFCTIILVLLYCIF